MRVLIVMVALMVAGCGTSFVELKNPTTGEVVQCRDQGATVWQGTDSVKACAQRFEAAGYKVVGTQ